MATLQRTLVNSSMSKWKLVVSGIPHGTVLGWVLFTVSISNMDSGLESTLSKSADDTSCVLQLNSGEKAYHPVGP